VKTLKILAVDDSPSFRALIGKLLSDYGHTVTLASSGEEALAHYHASQFDVVLMDRVMPDMDGLQAIREMRTTPCARWTPIILITATMDDVTLHESFQAGADEFLLKPINPLLLKIRLNSVIRIAGLQQSTQAVIDTLLEAVIRIDSLGLISLFNPAAEKLFGYAASEVIGCNVSMLMPSPDREQHDGYLANFLSGKPARIIGIGRKVYGLKRNGETFPLHLGVTEAGSPDGRFFIGIVRDLTQEEALQKEIERLAIEDTLTGLPNRHACIRHLAMRYAGEAGPTPLTLFYCDLDGFKKVNDESGHAAGDAVLIEAANRIRHALFVRDFFGRLGGDEFLIAVDGVLSDAEAQLIGERIIQSFQSPLATPFGDKRIGASLGFAHSRNHPAGPNALLEAADKAMYAAKRAGRGCVVG
jgi:diguanylate cyclase (GGDEF)-like protein/PAS domain S-box-containing protein